MRVRCAHSSSVSQFCILTQFFLPICYPPSDRTTRVDCWPQLHSGISAAGQPLCVPCMLITSATIVSGQERLYSQGDFFCHEAKVLYSSSNGDLNSPDSCIHCLVTLYLEGFVPPHSAEAPIISGFLFLQSEMGLPLVFFPFLPLYCYFWSTQQ